MQTRLQSFVESLHNLWFGFVLSWTAHVWLVMPATVWALAQGYSYGAVGFWTTVFYSLLSVFRTFGIRRWQNWKLEKQK